MEFDPLGELLGTEPKGLSHAGKYPTIEFHAQSLFVIVSKEVGHLIQ